MNSRQHDNDISVKTLYYKIPLFGADPACATDAGLTLFITGDGDALAQSRNLLNPEQFPEATQPATFALHCKKKKPGPRRVSS
jgi:hypothetical protein